MINIDYHFSRIGLRIKTFWKIKKLLKSFFLWDFVPPRLAPYHRWNMEAVTVMKKRYVAVLRRSCATFQCWEIALSFEIGATGSQRPGRGSWWQCSCQNVSWWLGGPLWCNRLFHYYFWLFFLLSTYCGMNLYKSAQKAKMCSILLFCILYQKIVTVHNIIAYHNNVLH